MSKRKVIEKEELEFSKIANVRVVIIGKDQNGMNKIIKWNLIKKSMEKKYFYYEKYYGSSTYANTPIATMNEEYFQMEIIVYINNNVYKINISKEEVRKQIDINYGQVEISTVTNNSDSDDLSVLPLNSPSFPKITNDNDIFNLELSLRDLYHFPGNPYEVSGCFIELK